MDDLVEQFVIEARELVQQASEDLLALEGAPDDRDRLENLFRSIHTLKGSVGLFDFGVMQGVLHHAENMLSQARIRNVAIDAALIDPLLAVVEWMDDGVLSISRTGQLSDAQNKQAARILGLLKSHATEPVTAQAFIKAAEAPAWAISLRQRWPAPLDAPSVAVRYEPHPECFFNGDDPFALVSRLPELRHLDFSLKGRSPSTQDYDPFRCNLVIEAIVGGSLSDLETVFRLIPDQVQLFPLGGPVAEPPSIPQNASSRSDSDRYANTMRVDAARIDRLVEIAGELVSAKNSLIPLVDEARNKGSPTLAGRILSSHYEIERLVISLYGAVTRARMVPLEQTFRRFPRLVRETSAKLGKAVDLVIEGESLEADREIVESLFEPILHLIRNSLDHGIEPESHRLQRGKPGRGRILLQARQFGDRIQVEVSDDGNGIDLEHIKNTAVLRGLISSNNAKTLSEMDVLQLICAPGFSTASTVSDISGRGVGLDAARRSVERFGGTLDIRSLAGSGTAFVLEFPISFAMEQLMVVKVGDERYGIPISTVVETCKVPISDIHPVRMGQAFVFRDKTIPFLHLSKLLNVPSLGSSANELKVLIVKAGESWIGVAVDAISERAETLTRPLGGLLQSVAGIAGTTLLGDGRVLLVLNLEELVQ